MSLRSVPMLCLVFAVGCGRTAPQAGPGGAGAMPPADVKMVTLVAKPVARTSEFVASIRSLASTTVQPQVDGIVTRVLVRSGDRVRAGQPLVQIDPGKQQAALSSLEANRSARQADVAYATQQLRRLQKLFEAGAVSRQRTGAGADGRANRRRAAPGHGSRDPREPRGAGILPRDCAGGRHRRRHARPRRRSRHDQHDHHDD